MKICIVGKFPPIEGGVSMHTYRYAHALAQRGHQVHMVTNAGEVRVPYRMFMREEDWARCEGDYGDGYVRVHWTAPFDKEQWHIPTSNPFITKLASIGAQVCADHDIDVVFSFYLQPYGIAGHLIAEMTGLPHVVKTAGSDAGRLWQHPQYQPLFNHVFKSAKYIVAASKVFENLQDQGVPSIRFRPDRQMTVPEDIFSPDGPVLDIDLLCRQIASSPDHAPLQWGTVRPGIPYVGTYGKLGNTKGTFALLRAVRHLLDAGQEVGLLVMGHEPPRSPVRFRDAVTELSLEDHVVQLPFLPHWRVPEFIRRCVAVCCLEQDFPITIHTPIMPREVLCCGTPLIASTEMIGKLPQSQKLVDGYNCFAVNDVNDTAELSGKIRDALDTAGDRRAMGKRARDYVREVQQSLRFPERMEQTLVMAVAGGTGPIADRVGLAQHKRFALTHLVLARAMSEGVPDLPPPPSDPTGEISWASRILTKLTGCVDAGATSLAPLCDAVRFDICLAEAAAARKPVAAESLPDRLFRLDLKKGTAFPDDIRGLVPRRLSAVHLHSFDHDVNAFLKASGSHELPPSVPARASYAVMFSEGNGRGIRTVVLDQAAGRLLESCDGTSTVGALCAQNIEPATADTGWVVDTVRRFFEIGLIGFTDEAPAIAAA